MNVIFTIYMYRMYVVMHIVFYNIGTHCSFSIIGTLDGKSKSTHTRPHLFRFQHEILETRHTGGADGHTEVRDGATHLALCTIACCTMAKFSSDWCQAMLGIRATVASLVGARRNTRGPDIDTDFQQRATGFPPCSETIVVALAQYFRGQQTVFGVRATVFLVAAFDGGPSIAVRPIDGELAGVPHPGEVSGASFRGEINHYFGTGFRWWVNFKRGHQGSPRLVCFAIASGTLTAGGVRPVHGTRHAIGFDASGTIGVVRIALGGMDGDGKRIGEHKGC